MPLLGRKQNQDIETSPKIPRTLKVHKVSITYNEDVCKMGFCELAKGTEPLQRGRPGCLWAQSASIKL